MHRPVNATTESIPLAVGPVKPQLTCSHCGRVGTAPQIVVNAYTIRGGLGPTEGKQWITECEAGCAPLRCQICGQTDSEVEIRRSDCHPWIHWAVCHDSRACIARRQLQRAGYGRTG